MLVCCEVGVDIVELERVGGGGDEQPPLSPVI